MAGNLIQNTTVTTLQYSKLSCHFGDWLWSSYQNVLF